MRFGKTEAESCYSMIGLVIHTHSQQQEICLMHHRCCQCVSPLAILKQRIRLLMMLWWKYITVWNFHAARRPKIKRMTGCCQHHYAQEETIYSGVWWNIKKHEHYNIKEMWRFTSFCSEVINLFKHFWGERRLKVIGCISFLPGLLKAKTDLLQLCFALITIVSVVLEWRRLSWTIIRKLTKKISQLMSRKHVQLLQF